MVPHEKTIEVYANPGEENHVAIRPASRKITKIIVKQTTGVLAGFDFELYNSKRPKDQHSQSSISGGEAEVNPIAYKILPTQNIGAGNNTLELFTEEGSSYA